MRHVLELREWGCLKCCPWQILCSQVVGDEVLKNGSVTCSDEERVAHISMTVEYRTRRTRKQRDYTCTRTARLSINRLRLHTEYSGSWQEEMRLT